MYASMSPFTRLEYVDLPLDVERPAIPPHAGAADWSIEARGRQLVIEIAPQAGHELKLGLGTRIDRQAQIVPHTRRALDRKESSHAKRAGESLVRSAR